ncbi:hypothetical protein H8E77_17115 [bacterium]|nr:hypothetical protein [bacterium]
MVAIADFTQSDKGNEIIAFEDEKTGHLYARIGESIMLSQKEFTSVLERV